MHKNLVVLLLVCVTALPPTMGKADDSWTLYIDETLHFITSVCSADLVSSVRKCSKLYMGKALEILRMPCKEVHSTARGLNYMKVSVKLKHQAGRVVPDRDVRGIAGRIEVPLAQPHRASDIYYSHRWEFNLNPSFRMNLTFLHFNVGTQRNLRMLRNSDAMSDTKQNMAVWAEYLRLRFKNSQNSLLLVGRRNKLLIVSEDKSFNLFVFLLFSPEKKVKISLQIVDVNSLTNFTFRDKGTTRNTFQVTHIIYPNKRASVGFSIILSKVCKLILDLTGAQQLRLYDGPDQHRDPVVISGQTAVMSAFLCYLLVFSKTEDKDLSLNIHFYGEHIHMPQWTIKTAESISFERCTQRVHCVLNVSSEIGFINVSVESLKFLGPNLYDCSFGGVSYFYPEKHNNRNQQKRYVEVNSLCGNLTNQPRMNTFDMMPMPYVSPSSSMVIVISRFQSVGEMEVNLTISTTKCRGMFPCSKGNLSFSVSLYKSTLGSGRCSRISDYMRSHQGQQFRLQFQLHSRSTSRSSIGSRSDTRCLRTRALFSRCISTSLDLT